MTGPYSGPAETGRPAHQAPTPWHPQPTGSHTPPPAIAPSTAPAPQWGPPAGPTPYPTSHAQSLTQPPPASPWGPPAGPPTSWPPPQAPYPQQTPYSQQTPYPPQVQYPPQAQYPQPDASPQGPPAGGLTCRICGGAPAIAATMRAHVGMIILMSWRSLPGPFCRTCGTAAMRQMTASTLALGWWGLVSLIVGAPFALIANLITAQRLRSLPLPGPHGQQLDPGVPLYKRPLAYVPVAVVLLLIVLSLATRHGR